MNAPDPGSVWVSRELLCRFRVVGLNEKYADMVDVVTDGTVAPKGMGMKDGEATMVPIEYFGTRLTPARGVS